AVGRAILDARTILIPDLLAPEAAELTVSQNLASEFGFRAMAAVPMMRERQPIGTLLLRKSQAGRFTPPRIGLLETSADQAVIAVENARLFDEVQARTKELSQSLDELRTAQDRLIQTEKLASLG